MDPAQQRTRGRRRRAARPRRAPRGKHAGKGRRALRRRRAPGGRPRPSQGGRRGKSPCKHWAAGNAPKLARRPQKVSGTHLSVPRSASCSAGGVRLAAAGSGGRSGPLSGSPRPRAGQERGQRSRRPYLRRRARGKAPPGFPPPAPGGFEVSLRPRPAPMSDSAPGGPAGHLGARRLRRTRPGRALPAAFPPVPPPPPHPCRYVSVAPPSRDTPPAGHGRSSQAAWRLHGRTRVPRRVTPRSENSV